MDRKHYINKFGWEAVSTLSLTILGAALVGMLLTDQVRVTFGVSAAGIGAALLGASITVRASLEAKEDTHE
ncbi:hypothetical protein [Halomonas elongata]|uniref:Uncharacterized protein n=1 Tax=Halomonas elongata (strain ATCC 33173 / DSM 2581 / NBRC 15536 / NCIMB 2198 / 1H9) TaxID=768066 RepID=A0ABZ0T9D5_HALED|nr:hypothetical protein [Halomonas elongata]WBF17713.1 hypothetical protein LM502_16805 [Halomonas elongata]WPU46554.1 hypothetical protein SR933_15040 [Halomonas elongata DSM 2581]